MYWMTFGWPWPKVTAVTLINKNLLFCKIKWESLNQSLQLCSYIPLVMVIIWLDFWGILLETSFCQIFFGNFGCIFPRSNTLLDISQEWLVRLMWNEKEMLRFDTGWTMWPWPLTSPMTLTFDFSRSNFKIAVSEELLSDRCETKRKQIRYWADCMLLPFDHTHDLDLVV